MLDKDIFPWLEGKPITPQQRKRSASIISDRVTGVLSDPIIRNAQEQRQFKVLTEYFTHNGYTHLRKVEDFREMPPMTFSFHVNVPVSHGENMLVNLPVDVVIQSKENSEFPLLVECKSAGDFANTNKRRKEEAVKFSQLKHTYGTDITLCLFLCGYFDTGYLGYEAAEGIDWVWEHRVEDFKKLGV